MGIEEEFNSEETFAKIQSKILDDGYSLEHHLKTVKELPKESRLKHYKELFKEGRISEEQYNTFIQE